MHWSTTQSETTNHELLPIDELLDNQSDQSQSIGKTRRGNKKDILLDWGALALSPKSNVDHMDALVGCAFVVSVVSESSKERNEKTNAATRRGFISVRWFTFRPPPAALCLKLETKTRQPPRKAVNFGMCSTS